MKWIFSLIIITLLIGCYQPEVQAPEPVVQETIETVEVPVEPEHADLQTADDTFTQLEKTIETLD
jgi:hypothetical protein|tara:strand:+ start:93 stop:287 length:195 start_codon:yes stop_codon:yes gene_type:complete